MNILVSITSRERREAREGRSVLSQRKGVGDRQDRVGRRRGDRAERRRARRIDRLDLLIIGRSVLKTRVGKRIGCRRSDLGPIARSVGASIDHEVRRRGVGVPGQVDLARRFGGCDKARGSSRERGELDSGERRIAEKLNDDLARSVRRRGKIFFDRFVHSPRGRVNIKLIKDDGSVD